MSGNTRILNEYKKASLMSGRVRVKYTSPSNMDDTETCLHEVWKPCTESAESLHELWKPCTESTASSKISEKAQKKRDRMLRNRSSAQLSRQKKKVFLETTVEDLRVARMTNENLTATIEDLKKIIAQKDREIARLTKNFIETLLK